MITPFQFVRVAETAETVTPDPGWDTLLVLSVPVGEIGNVVVSFSATVQCEYTTPSANFLGAAVRFVWDDEPLIDAGFIDFDPAIGPPNIDTYAGALLLESAVPNVAPGSHTLEVQWNTNAADQRATIFANNGRVKVEGKS